MTRRAFPALLLAAALLLTGCSAMLERSYVSVEEHNENPVSDGGSALRVESYQDLVSAVLYYVSRGQETGTIRFYNYPRDPDGDLDSACLEVAQEDPLGGLRGGLYPVRAGTHRLLLRGNPFHYIPPHGGADFIRGVGHRRHRYPGGAGARPWSSSLRRSC